MLARRNAGRRMTAFRGVCGGGGDWGRGLRAGCCGVGAAYCPTRTSLECAGKMRAGECGVGGILLWGLWWGLWRGGGGCGCGGAGRGSSAVKKPGQKPDNQRRLHRRQAQPNADHPFGESCLIWALSALRSDLVARLSRAYRKSSVVARLARSDLVAGTPAYCPRRTSAAKPWRLPPQPATRPSI